MNKRVKNNIALFIAFVYLAFACLYVTACHEKNSHLKVAGGFTKIYEGNDFSHKTGMVFLSRPRVVNQRMANVFVAAILFVFLAATATVNATSLVSRFSPFLLFTYHFKFIRYRTLRL